MGSGCSCPACLAAAQPEPYSGVHAQKVPAKGPQRAAFCAELLASWCVLKKCAAFSKRSLLQPAPRDSRLAHSAPHRRRILAQEAPVLRLLQVSVCCRSGRCVLPWLRDRSSHSGASLPQAQGSVPQAVRPLQYMVMLALKEVQKLSAPTFALLWSDCVSQRRAGQALLLSIASALQLTAAADLGPLADSIAVILQQAALLGMRTLHVEFAAVAVVGAVLRCMGEEGTAAAQQAWSTAFSLFMEGLLAAAQAPQRPGQRSPKVAPASSPDAAPCAPAGTQLSAADSLPSVPAAGAGGVTP